MKIQVLGIIILLVFLKGILGGKHSIIYPKLFRIDTDETVVISLHDYGNTEVQVTCYLTDYPYRNQIFSRVETRGRADQPIAFTVKATRDAFESAQSLNNKKVEMNIEIEFQGGRYPEIRKTVRVYLTGESDYIFIQTKRPVYKPGDQVQIRVIPLNLQMLPLKQDLVEITVQTPDRVGVWKELGRFPPTDFLEVTYPIPDDPPLGIWFVEAKINNTLHTSSSSTRFLVDKYVLPTYNVDLELDKSHVKPRESINGNFTAKYSYGEPVVGLYSLTGSVKFPNSEEKLEFYARPSSVWKRSLQLQQSENGEKSFSISTENVVDAANTTWEDLISRGATISVQVSVMGLSEGIFESDEIDGILITDSPYTIDMSHTSKFFIPSLTHTLKIIVRDVVTNEPVPDIPVAVEAISETKTGTTDEEGYVEIELETSPNSDQMDIIIRTDHGDLNPDHQAEIVYTLRKYRSRSGAYLRLTAPAHATVGQNINIRFRPRGSSPTEIFYLVLSRSIIILSGKKSTSGGREASQSLLVTRKMSPSIRVVAYYMSGNEVVSDSVWIDINDVCISKELIINVPQRPVEPGSPVTITFQGEGNAMVGVSGVDRAAYFLNDEGRLDREKMFKKMNSFDLGCSMAGGQDGLDVLQEAGLAYTSGSRTTPTVDEAGCPDASSSERKKRSVALGTLSEIDTDIERKCFKDGRIENLAGESCDIRKSRVMKWQHDKQSPEYRVCADAFMLGCDQGEFIRKTLVKINRRGLSSSGFRVDRSSSPPSVRRRFIESWLWRTEHLNNNGDVSHQSTAPDSITTYDIDAVSVHETEGFCVAKPAQVKVFKDLFIKLYLPYSVKVREQVQIRAAVFNYHPTRNRVVDLKIRGDSSLCTQYTAGEWSDVATLDVASGSSTTFSFTTIPLTTGMKDIEFDVRSQNGTRDQIFKQLKVEDSGSEEHFSRSFDLDPSLRDSGRRIHFQFPDDDVVPGSKKCWIYGHMNFLGPIIEFDPIAETPENLAGVLGIPYGCGEQNIMVCGPNVFAFNYFKSKGNVRASTQSEIKKYIIDGYTREQGHRNSGVWSVYSSSPPTIWINAFVDKIFLHALEVWPDMDVQPICDSIRWIISRQQRDGRFSEAEHARYYRINVAAGGDVALTAYVIIALKEAPLPCDVVINSQVVTSISRATTYLRSHVNDDDLIPFTAAITAYALSLVDPRHSSTNTANQRLNNMKRRNGDETFWQTAEESVDNIDLPPWYSSRRPTIDIESTAYALLAQVTIAESWGSNVGKSEVDFINRIARWLVNQRNDRGGFQSSQTTVTAIQSLTRYGTWIETVDPPPRNPHLDLTLTSASGTSWEGGHNFGLDESNEFYKKELAIPPDVVQGSSTIDVDVSGEGRGSLSYRCVYRVTKDSEVCHFDIVADTVMMGLRDESGLEEAEPGKGKNVMKFKVIVSKLTPGSTSMAIIDVALISGFRPVEATLDSLTVERAVDGVIDRYEVTKQNVRLYVERIPPKNGDDPPLKIAFTLQQYAMVDNPNPAKVTVYEYYEPEVKCSKFYSVPDGSPMLQTTCSPVSFDDPGSQQCKCAAGGCPTCRTREEQLEKTCGRRYRCHSACRGPEINCHNLHKSVCGRNFGFMAEMTSIDSNSNPNFVKLQAEVKKVLRSQTDSGLRSSELRTFVMRRDCFNNCVDVALRNLANNGSYFIPGRTFLIMGKEPEKSIISDGSERFTYFLDQDAVLERSVTPEKCKKHEKRRNACRRSKTEKCIKTRRILKICDNQDDMIKGMDDGCDF